MKSLIVKIKKYRTHILFGAAIIILLAGLGFQYFKEYHSKDENTLKAQHHSQIIVFDVNTGAKVDASVITKAGLKNPPKPVVPANTKPAQISFIISGLGLNGADTQKAIGMQKEFILSFSPYADQGLQLSKAGHLAGHSILVDLPVQMKDAAAKPGNLALTVDNNQFKNVRNFSAVLSKVDWLSGVLVPADDIFSKSNGFTPIIQEIAKRKIYLAYPGETDGLETTAKDNEVELVKIDAVIDGTGDLDKQLAALEDLGHKNGFAVAMLKNTSSDSLDKINAWAAGAAARNVHLAATTQ